MTGKAIQMSFTLMIVPALSTGSLLRLSDHLLVDPQEGHMRQKKAVIYGGVGAGGENLLVGLWQATM